MLNNKYIKALGYAIALVCAGFIFKALISLDINWDLVASPKKTALFLTVFSSVSVVCVFLSAFGWGIILDFINGQKVENSLVFDVYIKSNLFKYLPGNIMHFAGRNIFMGSLGFKQTDILFCTLIEVFLLIISACLFSFVISGGELLNIFYSYIAQIDLKILIALAVLFIILVMALVYFGIFKKSVVSVLKKCVNIGFIKVILKILFIDITTQILPGILLFFIFKKLLNLGLNASDFGLCISGYAISWVVGFIVPGAPGGIGVRESVLILLLGKRFGMDMTLLASVYLRGINILGDVFAYLTQLLLNNTEKRKKAEVL